MVQIPLYLYPMGSEQVEGYLQNLPVASCVTELSSLFCECLLPNPRKIKRVLNIFTLHVNIAKSGPGRQPIDYGLLAKMVLLQQQWPEFYRRILLEPSLAGIMQNVYKGSRKISTKIDWNEFPASVQEHFEFCHNLFKTSPPQLKELFTQDPSFLNELNGIVDLKPYLYMLG
jgi:hypothetical protein